MLAAGDGLPDGGAQALRAARDQRAAREGRHTTLGVMEASVWRVGDVGVLKLGRTLHYSGDDTPWKVNQHGT